MPNPISPEPPGLSVCLCRPLWIGVIVVTMLATVGSWAHFHSQRTGVFSYENYQRIRVGMATGEVESLLGMPGKEIEDAELPHVVDWSEPIESPQRTKPVVKGERFLQWRVEHGERIVVGLRGGSVSEKWYWEPSL
jgi:hypothetical protein